MLPIRLLKAISEISPVWSLKEKRDNNQHNLKLDSDAKEPNFNCRWATSLAERLCTFSVLKLGGLSDATETAATSLLHVCLQCCLWLLGSFSRCGQVNGVFTVWPSALSVYCLKTYEGTNPLFVFNTCSSRFLRIMFLQVLQLLDSLVLDKVLWK